MSKTILTMTGITKRFPGVLALDGVDFSLKMGEIHAIIGQNGAGKSTLMKILAGDLSPTEGTVEIDGTNVVFRHPQEAQRMGISIVYQELSLLPNMTVGQNIFLSREPGPLSFFIRDRKIRQESKRVLGILGIEGIDADVLVKDLSLAQRQLIEIARAISYQPRILILDEPTATLSPSEAERMFEVLQRLRKQGIGIIYISHRLKEIIQHCQSGTVLRNGRVVDTVRMDSVDESTLIEKMIGQKRETFYRHTSLEQIESKTPLLSLRNFSIPNSKVESFDVDLNEGEIVGLTGLLGAGQNEVARALYGVGQGYRGTIQIRGRNVRIDSPRGALSHGICLLTENRKEEGIFMDLSVRQNVTMPFVDLFKSAWLPYLSTAKECAAVSEIIEAANIVTASQESELRTLSGGNQQKVILGRWLLTEPDVFVFIEPTRGIDVGAKNEIYKKLDELAKTGKAILVISTDLIEVLGICDRVIVMHEGRLVRTFSKAEASEQSILASIQGAQR
mgnify:CR=1 FL=1